MDSLKIKICQVAASDQAIRFLLLNQIRFLKEQGYQVSAVCSKGTWVEDIREQGIEVKIINISRKVFSPLSDLTAFFKLFLHFKKQRFHIVHTHTPKPALLGQMAAKLAGIPIIINTWHGFYFNEHSPLLRRKLFILVEKTAALFSDLIFSQNAKDIETAVKEKIAKPSKMRFLGNGINLERFNLKRFSEEFLNKKKQELGLPFHFKIIGMVGRLVKEKGYLELFEAFSKVLNRFPKTLLLVLGPKDPEKRDSLDPEIVKDYGIEKNVVFLGERRDIDEIYPLMDIFVLPSWREGFPKSVLEACAMQRPIVVTDIKGCRQAVDKGETGILVPLRNPEKLSGAIIWLFAHPQMAGQMAKRAKEKAERDFDENKVFNRIREGYQELITKKLK